MASLVLLVEALWIRRQACDCLENLSLSEEGAKKETNKNSNHELGKRGTAVDDKPPYDNCGLGKEGWNMAEFCWWP
ncbi:hypothetical protein SLA2020_373730 [Shorea laevis]